MAVTSATSSISYTGNNSTTTSYAVPFVFLENSHLAATAKVTATGVESAVTLVDHIGAGNPSGGNVRTAVAVPATSTLTIFRTVPATQTTTYQEGGDFPAASHERALDKLTFLSQQNERAVERSFRVTEGSGTKNEVVAVPNTLIGLDSSNQPKALTVSEIKSLLAISGTTLSVPAGIKTFADAGERALAVPEFTGQLGTQRDTADIYISTGTAAGNWSLVDENMSLADFASGFFTADATGRGKFGSGFVDAGLIASDSVTTAKIVNANVTSAKLAYDNGPTGGFRNRIINGNFNIWQRGTSFTGANVFGADRWFNGQIGSSCTMSREAFALGQTDVPNEPTYFCRMTVSSSSGVGNYVFLQQTIEDVRTLAGQSVTVSFYAKADAVKSISVEMLQYFGTGGSPSAAVQASETTKATLGTGWQKIIVAMTLPSIIGKNLGSNANHSVLFRIWLDAGSDFNANTVSLGQQSGTFDIAQVQVEQGSVATPFEARPIGTELALCQRYFQLFGAGTTGQEETDTTFSIAGALRQTMRVAPTATYVGSTYSQRITALDRTITGVSINTSVISNEAVWILFNCSGGNLPSRIFQDRNALSPIQLSAEL